MLAGKLKVDDIGGVQDASLHFQFRFVSGDVLVLVLAAENDVDPASAPRYLY